MAKTLQHRRDTTTNLASEAGAIGEFFMDTTKNTLVVMDGSTNGGHPLQSELVSGTSIKTINGTSLLGSGNITISSYTDSDVDTHLNQTNPTAGYVLSWNGSDYAWVAQGGGGGGGEIALSGTNLYSDNLTNFGTTLTTGADNIVMGDEAGNSITSGVDNIALGAGALKTITNRYGNVGIGRFALAFSSSSNVCTAIGNAAMTSNNGENNVGIGASAFSGNVTGDYNVAVGAYSGTNVTGAAQFNTYIGGQAGYFAGQSGYAPQKNVYIGSLAAQHFAQASYCTIIGADTGGASSGNTATGDNNTCLGYQAAISALSVSNEITLGNSSISALRCQVTSITSLSDARDKTDIEDLPAGLDFVNELRPVKFTWNMRDGAKVNEPDTGFIAQDLQSVQENTGIDIPGLVYDTNPEKLEAAYGKLIPVLVKSIQELTAKVNELENRLN